MSTGSTTVEWRRRDVQIGLLFAGTVITAISTLTISLLFPEAGEGGFFTYESVVPTRAFHQVFLTLVGVNLVVAVVSVGLASLSLVPARGWQWATAGFAVAVFGVGFYTVGVGGWAMLYYFAAASPALDPATASAFVESANADAFRIFGSAAGGAILIVVGGLILSVGLWRSGNVPKWLIVLSVIGSIITFFLPTTGLVGVFVEFPQAFSGALLGWYAWQRRHSISQDRPVAAAAAVG
jgi:hypothetical protein